MHARARAHYEPAPARTSRLSLQKSLSSPRVLLARPSRTRTCVAAPHGVEGFAGYIRAFTRSDWVVYVHTRIYTHRYMFILYTYIHTRLYTYIYTYA